MTPREAMVHWVKEREAVRVRRTQGMTAPWTDDEIIGKYRFCNVRREDDLVTIWVREHIREPFAQHQHLWFMLAMARWINWPETLQELIQTERAWPSDTDFNLHRVRDVLNMRAGRGDKVFTGAYTINAPPKGDLKTDYVALQVLGEPWSRRERIQRTLEREDASLRAAHAELMSYKAWGPFMSYQVVVDLRFTRYLRNAEDVSTWAAAGPGTIRGLNRIAGRQTDKALEQWKALHEMRALYEWLPGETGVAMDFSDIPNVLCETDKYLRVLNEEGAPRAVYRSHANAPRPPHTPRRRTGVSMSAQHTYRGIDRRRLS